MSNQTLSNILKHTLTHPHRLSQTLVLINVIFTLGLRELELFKTLSFEKIINALLLNAC